MNTAWTFYNERQSNSSASSHSSSLRGHKIYQSLLSKDQAAYRGLCLNGSVIPVLLLRCGPALHLAVVKYDLKSTSTRSQRSYRSALAHLLLIVVCYGALVETVHTHGRISAGKANVEAAYDSSRSQSSSQRYSDQKECSTCQFQRQLFDGFVSVAPFARTPTTEFAFESSSVVFYISTLTKPHSGRGPPPSRA